MKEILNPFCLKDKTILVTGASSGIGRQIALSLSQQGAVLIINGRNKERLLNTLELLDGKGHQYFCGDITDNAIIEKISNDISNLNGIVHTAGMMKLLPFKFVKEIDLREIMEVNFFSPLNLTMSLFQKKKIKNSSSIIFITSINGAIIGSKANSVYAASKGALTGIIKSMALDLAKSKIRVNNIAPGMIETEGISEIKATVSEDLIKQDILKYPLGCYGKPEDIANACTYFLSDASKWVTGTTLVIDGGFTIQ